MTPIEISNLINLYLQEINSNVYGNVLKEEKDLFFNTEVLQYIRNTINPKNNRTQTGFEYTKEKYDNLRELKRTVELPVYKSTGNFIYSSLPSDYFRIINSASSIVTFCNTPVTATTTISKYIVKVKLTKDTSTTEFYKNFKLIETTGDVGTKFDLATFYPDGLVDADLKYVVYQLIFEEINKLSGYKCYWNLYNGEFYDDTLIIEKDTNFVMTIEEGYLPTPVATSTGATKIDYTKTTVTFDGDFHFKANRLIAAEDYQMISDSQFGKTHKNSPLSYIEKDFIFVEVPENSMVDSIKLQYIKKPTLLNISLNRNTDIGNDVIDIICRKCAEHIAYVKSNNNAQLVERQNIFIE